MKQLHEVGVSTRSVDSFAWCSCGWQGPPRELREVAIDDALNHPSRQPKALGYLDNEAGAAEWAKGRRRQMRRERYVR